MKPLLVMTAVIEAGAGVALLCCPSTMVKLLLGSPLDTSAAVTLGRVAGAALLTLVIACWLARGDGQSHAGIALVAAMLFYNAAVVVILALAGIYSGACGVALWPAVVLHAGLAVWCIACLRGKWVRVDAVGDSPDPSHREETLK
jgi:hypothetical protein